VVRSLYKRLLQDGLKPWLDEEDLLPGMSWQEEISRAVRAAGAVVVCLSQKSARQGFVQKEIKFALDVAEEKPEGMIYIIPAKLDPKCDVPERLRKWQWVDLFRNDGYSKLVKAILSRPRAEDEDHLTAAQTPVQTSPLPTSLESRLLRLGLPTAHLERGVRWWESSSQREVAAQIDKNGEWMFFEREPSDAKWDVLKPNDQLRAQADKMYRERVATLLRKPSARKSKHGGKSKHL